MTDPEPSLLNIPETSKWTRIPEATLRYYRHNGIGPRSFLVGRRVMYRREDVEAWLEEQYNRTAV